MFGEKQTDQMRESEKLDSEAKEVVRKQEESKACRLRVSIRHRADHTVTQHQQTKRAVYAPIFIPPQDIVVMLVKCEPCPSTQPILCNTELCKRMQRGFLSQCYSKLSMWAVDKEMQSGSPLTPGSLCKQYMKLLGTLLITL